MSTSDDEIISVYSNENIPLEDMQIAENEDQNFHEDHYGLVNFNMQRKMISSGQNIPSCNIGDVNIVGTPNHLHLGTKLIINGPLNIPYESGGNIYGINEDDDNYINTEREEDVQEMGLEDNYTKIQGLHLGLQLITKKSYILLNRYLLVFIAFLLIEIIILILYFTISSQQKISSEIQGLRLRQISKNVSNFISRKNDWGTENACKVSCPLKRKTEIRLVSPKTLLFTCSITSGHECKTELIEDLKSYRDTPESFNDIYYNYVIGMGGVINEARSLTCSYNEQFLQKDNHDETLVIGVSFCFPSNSEANMFKTSNEEKAMKKLLARLRENGILGNYGFKLSEVCKESLIAKILKKQFDVSFYKEDYNNISTTMSIRAQNSLLFQKYDDITPKNEITQINSSLFNKIGTYQNIKNENITVRFFYAEQLDFPTLPNDCNNRKECEKEIQKNMENHKSNISQFKINYFAFMGKDPVIFSFYPLNSTFSTKTNQSFISILIKKPHEYNLPEKYFPALSEVLSPIVAKVNKFITYKHVNFQFLCDQESVGDKDAFTYFEFFSNVSYIFKGDLENPKETCATSLVSYLKGPNQSI